ncbi:uncharacterized protein MYCGRDRAFT_106402, partial [Zymoseptoria tritici IPO323]
HIPPSIVRQNAEGKEYTPHPRARTFSAKYNSSPRQTFFFPPNFRSFPQQQARSLLVLLLPPPPQCPPSPKVARRHRA